MVNKNKLEMLDRAGHGLALVNSFLVSYNSIKRYKTDIISYDTCILGVVTYVEMMVLASPGRYIHDIMLQLPKCGSFDIACFD